MAIWQCDFFIVPESTYKNYGQFLRPSEYNEIDDSIFWLGIKHHYQLFEEIEDVMPQTNSWSDKILMYGEENSTVLNVLCEKELIVSVTLRISFLENYYDKIDRLLGLLIDYKLLLLSNDLSPISLNTASVKNVIRNSAQYRRYNGHTRDN